MQIVTNLWLFRPTIPNNCRHAKPFFGFQIPELGIESRSVKFTNQLWLTFIKMLETGRPSTSYKPNKSWGGLVRMKKKSLFCIFSGTEATERTEGYPVFRGCAKLVECDAESQLNFGGPRNTGGAGSLTYCGDSVGGRDGPRRSGHSDRLNHQPGGGVLFNADRPSL